MKTRTLLLWACRIVAAAILLQTLFFKLTGAPESVYIFSALGVEPWGRYAAAIIELAAAVLLLLPGRAICGALLALGTMFGALGAHFTRLGIEVQGDGGLLFGLAWVVTLCAAIVLYHEVRGRLRLWLGRPKT